jgi:tRNA-Thr(GGU) m(6)t(6)A37 methyltransferase TsaA
MEFVMEAIGVIHTPLIEGSDVPIQSSRSDIKGIVEVYPQYMEGLEGIEGFSHIYLLYGFHCLNKPVDMKVKPFLDEYLHGIYATRFPSRPNPIGLSIVRLDQRNDGQLLFTGADMLDGTPLLDIKPYIPDFDVFKVTKTGWYRNRSHL